MKLIIYEFFGDVLLLNLPQLQYDLILCFQLLREQHVALNQV